MFNIKTRDNDYYKNSVVLTGTIESINDCDAHAVNSETRTFTLKIKRNSGYCDLIPCETFLDMTEDSTLLEVGNRITVVGKMFGRFIGGYAPEKKGKLYVKCFAKKIFVADGDDSNNCTISGRIKKIGEIRETPLGRRCLDIIITKPRHTFPVIVFGQDACEAFAEFKAGDDIEFSGRIQSRRYVKEEEEHMTIELAPHTLYK